MAHSPPASPIQLPQRPLSAIAKPPPRSQSRMSVSSKPGSGSRASDDDSRTAVKVAVRIRPSLKPEDPGYDLIPQRFQRSMVQTTSNTSLAIESPQGRKLFVFDRVFGPDVMQDGIWDYLADSVVAFTQGYNVSLLAYGQSGAGKSYTMGTSGPSEQHDENMMGVIPRAASALFDKLNASRSGSQSNRASMTISQLRTPRGYGHQNMLGDRNWSLKATYVEIYNEQLRDLLVPDSTPISERGSVAIREDAKGNIILTGLHQVDIDSVDDLMSALEFGSSIRQTDATAINAKSSRSHAVFSLNLVQRKSHPFANGSEKRFSVPIEAMTGQDMSVTTDSKLHFVDLAGSERLKNTGAQGERAKEGISINAGLASLGKVISQLSSRQPGSHVSYRDSKLTRLLQDSLGGNAITYMIACVTPAEFHLSETLNTVQYAQRARAIQSKPRIQQVDEGDKQALIDRLRAEVSFLREQIRSASVGAGSPRRPSGPTTDRSDRQNEREVELQNQLLDVQENYSALSQRHAMLIAEMARAREHESEEKPGDSGDSATDRLNRSNSFAQAVEQVVLEYEKTIQTLEQSLSNTRATLSNTETNLLEKMTKCAYVETINNQLQSRLQKLMDREASTENYLHDLEAKLDGHTSGEEKNATIILELRKEIARVRENEASCEDYISTLEERLAEADQDAELMQREIDRLEQVVERQRSLGKLDALLHELDGVDGAKDSPATNGNGRQLASHSRTQSHISHPNHLGGPILEDDERAEDAGMNGHSPPQTAGGQSDRDGTHTPAQSRLVADKLESVTQELIDLRVEHETTVNDLQDLQAKYEEAMRSLADLRQDVADEARHPPHIRDSVLSLTSDMHARAEPLASPTKSVTMTDGLRSSATRSLSSELSAIESVDTDATSEDGTATAKPGLSSETLVASQTALKTELERLRQLTEEREAAEKELATKYAELESKHSEALDMVEELKTEVSKVRAVEATSPRQSTPVIRRKSSHNIMVIDRAHRSFASLRNIATDNFEDRPEVMQSFELNLNAAMHELHSRCERIQELEADVASARKEMETKMTIISGLTRERSSLKAGPMDMSMVANLREQLEKNEMRLREMRESHAARERELTAELEQLRVSLSEHKTNQESRLSADVGQEYEERIVQLQDELTSWEDKHKSVLDSMQATEGQLRQTVQQLEAQVVTLNASLVDSQARVNSDTTDAAKEVEQKHHNLVTFLRSEIDEYKAVINQNAAQVSELEKSHTAARIEADKLSKAQAESANEAARYQKLVTELEEKVAAHDEATKAHVAALEQLQADHAKEIADLKAREQKGYEEQVEVLMSEHAEAIQRLESDLSLARDELMQVAARVAHALGSDVNVDALTEQVETLTAAHQARADQQKEAGELEARIAELTRINETTSRDLEAAKAALSEVLAGESQPPASVTEQVTAVKGRLSDLEVKNKKNSRLIEELEEQLQNNYDEAQVTSKRLSTLQTERNAQLEEVTAARIKLQAELDSIREEYSSLQAKYQESVGNAAGDVNRSNSNSTIRKSASHASLPSPPPAIPLPPLPSAARSGSPTNGPSTSPHSRAAKEGATISQITEDQEVQLSTIKKHLYAERQLTQTLEEALEDLEKQSKKFKADGDAWKKRAQELEGEVKELKERPVETQQDNRWSLHAVEEERKKRQAAEAARRQLEERMNAINKGKKKKGSLNCF